MATAHFIEKIQVTPTDWSFRFSKPEGYTYQAGQYAVIRMTMKYPDNRFGARTCSFSSSPTENFLQFTFTMRDTGFKKTLMDLVEGEEVTITPARGLLTLDMVHTDQVVMIAGGIGVAPFRSIVKYMHDCHISSPRIGLLYSDKDHHEIAFGDEWESYRDLSLLITLTRLDDKHPWEGNRGRITWDMIRSLSDTDRPVTYMLCGSPEMVQFTTDLLTSRAISKEFIMQELFTGY